MKAIPYSPDISVPCVELGEELGSGSFGAVFKARHLALDVDVAVKIIDTASGDSAVVEKTLSEARLMARLDHPNLLRVHDAGRLGTRIYLVFELMDSSCSIIRHAGADHAFNLARQLLSGLQALHDARILHRDIKPANCLLRNRDGRVKLADLGIAVLQGTKSDKVYDTAGTLPFMAPELFDSPPRYSPASDLYAMGLTLACMCLDEDPFPSGSLGEILAWTGGGERPVLSVLRPDLAPTLSGLINRMISPNIEDRPESASAALASLGITPAAISDIRPLQDVPGVTIGPWIIGGQVYEDPNWRTFAVTHARTGVAGRLSHIQPNGPLGKSSELILSSAERASRLDHPGILDVIDWGLMNGRAYIITEPQGRTIVNFVKSSGPLDEADAVEFGLAIANALEYLHEGGLVYQVVDPGGVVITPDARSAELSSPVYCVPAGTSSYDTEGKWLRVIVPQYAAPESIIGRHGVIQPAADIYGLGEVMYFMLTGRPAYGSVEGAALALAKASPPPDVRELAPMLTAPIAILVSEMMNPDPKLRPSARDVRERLTRISRRKRGVGERTLLRTTSKDIDSTILS